MKPINTIIKMTVVGVVLFALNACDKKNTDESNTAVPTQTTQQSTQSDANTQTVTPTQENGTVTGGTQSGANGGDGSNSVNGQSSNVGGSDTHEASEAQDNNGTTTQTEDNTISTETNTTTTGDTNTTGTNDTNATESNDENATDNGDDTKTTTADVTPPVITLKGEVNITLEQGEPYKELGATAVDAVDGNVTVTISGNVDTNTTGMYTVTYRAKDKAGNEATATRDVSVVTPTLTDMTLESNATTLNVGESVQLFVTGMYTDGNRKQIDANITYTITPSDKADINNNMLTAKKDGNVTVQATLDDKTSNPVTLNIYWEVNGHRLPPEPDPKVNNATLLGIDSNNNGVRDDVERKIYEKYPVKLQRALLMDRAKFYQLTLKSSVSEARKIVKKSISIGNCLLHLKHIEQRSVTWREDRTFIKNLTFNTKERIRKYLDYNLALSGGVYGSSPSDWNRDACSEEIKQVLEEMGL